MEYKSLGRIKLGLHLQKQMGSANICKVCLGCVELQSRGRSALKIICVCFVLFCFVFKMQQNTCKYNWPIHFVRIAIWKIMLTAKSQNKTKENKKKKNKTKIKTKQSKKKKSPQKRKEKEKKEEKNVFSSDKINEKLTLWHCPCNHGNYLNAVFSSFWLINHRSLVLRKFVTIATNQCQTHLL